MPFGRIGISSPDLVEMWEHGCPKSPVWSDDGLEEERGEDASSVVYYEQNVDNLAIEVVGQHWTSEVICFFLEDWEVRRVALSCHLSMDLLCQEMRDVCKESSESLNSLRSLCSECQRSSLVELSQRQSFFLIVDGR